MRRFWSRPLSVALLGAAVFPLAGCAFVSDVFSSDLFGALGLDVNRFQPAPGTIIVNFHNQVGVPVVFLAYESADSQDLTQDTRNFSVSVNPGETTNEVISCPVGLVSLGTVDADFAVDATGAIVIPDDQVAYAGAPLILNRDFQCGDVIDVTILPDLGTDNGFTFQIRVFRGS